MSRPQVVCRSHSHQGIMADIPALLLSGYSRSRVTAQLVAVEPGVAAGCGEMVAEARALGLRVRSSVSTGMRLSAGQALAELYGPPLEVLKAEDRLLGMVGKFCGVARAASLAKDLAGRVRVVCGGWKKMPLELKHGLRRALEAGGIQTRIIDTPMVYLSKNHLRVLGSVRRAMEAALAIPGRDVVIQICGETGPIHLEAREAAALGAKVVFVDTGRLDDLNAVAGNLRDMGLRGGVELAFAGGITLEDLPGLAKADLDAVDMGRALIDAPLLDLRYRVMP